MNKKPQYFPIRVNGYFDRTLAAWFAPLQHANDPNSEVALFGPVRDQPELLRRADQAR